MNTCVVYNGLPRTYKYCLQNHSNSFWKKYNITDCFAHFWDDKNHRKAPWSSCHISDIDTTKEEIVSAFNAKKITIEEDTFPIVKNCVEYSVQRCGYNFDNFSKDEIFNQCLTALKSSALSLRRSFEIIKDTNYDYYAIARPDTLWSENMDDWPDLDGKTDYHFREILWIFKKDTFEKFSQKIFHIDEYVLELLKNDSNPEVQNYNFITSEAIENLHFKSLGIDKSKFFHITSMKSQIHRGKYIQN